MGHAIDNVAKYVAPVLGGVIGSVIPGVGTALGAAIGGGLQTGISTHNVGKGLLSAGGSYIGGNLGSALGGNLGTVGSGLSTALGSTAGNAVSSAIGPSLSGVGIGSILGANVGSSLAESLSPAKPSQPSSPQNSGTNLLQKPFVPTQQPQKNLPASFSAFGGLNPQQQATNIATQGVYGGGNGPEEQSYFMNLENRRLIDQSGNMQPLSTLQPIEQSYLNQLGLGGYSNTNDLLHAISTWQSGAIH